MRKSLIVRARDFVLKLDRDNLFLLSSSISYYSAVAIAPFLLILLSVTALMGGDIQEKAIDLASTFSPQVGQLIHLIILNVNKSVNFGSLSGLIGLAILFFMSSLVFVQIRYAFDVIYGHHERKGSMSVLKYVYDRLFAMLLVFIAGLFLIVSSMIPGVVQVFVHNREMFFYGVMAVNFGIYVAMFWGIHFFTPSKRPHKKDAFYMAVLSSLFFHLGNTLLGLYFREIASSSIYGAAGTLLVFLIWTYYSSFTLFLSAELYLFVKKTRKIHAIF